jgi:hypothetical protein
MTYHLPGPPHAEPDPEPRNKNATIPPTETETEPGAAQPLDDTPVPPLTEPADTNGG